MVTGARTDYLQDKGPIRTHHQAAHGLCVCVCVCVSFAAKVRSPFREEAPWQLQLLPPLVCAPQPLLSGPKPSPLTLQLLDLETRIFHLGFCFFFF